MAKVKFTIKNEKGEDVLKKSKEITTRDYRDYLVMNDSLTSDLSEVEKLDKQLAFIASLFDDVTVEQLLEYTDFAKVISIFTEIYAHLVGDVDPKGKS
ncbi:phage tail assembly chaperone G [Streptococcus mitis]|uniref:phage tail assembly chaperone G n=1 Tax=Streptococcus mitis TaxID=28037 RepID=UPI0039C18B71